MSNDESKEWLNRKIRDKSITCYSESDLKLDPTHIGHGGFGVVHKATIKKSGIIVARKTSSPGQYGDDGEYFKHLVKEVRCLLLPRGTVVVVFVVVVLIKKQYFRFKYVVPIGYSLIISCKCT